MNCSCQNQAATITLPDCPEQSSFGFGYHDLQKNCLTRQVQIRSKLTPALSCKFQYIKSHVHISYRLSTYSDFLILHIYFVIWACLGNGQAGPTR